MKSDHRHELKTNELADDATVRQKLEQLPVEVIDEGYETVTEGVPA